MFASKVSFYQHTKDLLNSRPMSRTDKGKLRKQRVIEYVRELKFGECQKSDLITAAGYDIRDKQQYQNGWAFIDRLINTNVLQVSSGSNPKNSYVKKWVVLADVHTVKPATVTNDHGKMTYPEGDGETAIKPRKEGVHFPEAPKPDKVVISSEKPHHSTFHWTAKEDKPVVTPDNLLEQAKTFAWNTNSDSLREFVAWVKR